MALFVWIAVATALWHFTIFVPDRFPGGMVGAFAFANAGLLVVGQDAGDGVRKDRDDPSRPGEG
jgi:hypothetical protein